jgi:hypothetical protein
VRELGSIRRSFLAYISLRSAMVLDYRYMAGDVTCIHSAIDGIGAERGDLRALANSFHSWPHVLVVGCKSSSAWLMHMNIDAKDAALVEEKGVQAEKREPPKGKLKGSIPLLGRHIPHAPGLPAALHSRRIAPLLPFRQVHRSSRQVRRSR